MIQGIKLHLSGLLLLVAFFSFTTPGKSQDTEGIKLIEEARDMVAYYEKKGWSLWKMQVNQVKSNRFSTMDITDNVSGEFKYLILAVPTHDIQEPKLGVSIIKDNVVVNKNAGSSLGESLARVVTPHQSQGIQANFQATYLLNERDIYRSKVAFFVFYRDRRDKED